MKEILICPVCGGALGTVGRAFRCERGHSYDISKEGYVNLLTGAKGGQHGDNLLMAAARRRFLDAGYYEPLAAAFEKALHTYVCEGGTLLDIGCGEGYYTARARRVLGETGGTVHAFDISKEALRYAAKRGAANRLFVAGAYGMPVASNSVDAVSLFFSPFCREEILRVLRTGGVFFMAYPGERHLYGLKEAVYDTPYLNRPTDPSMEGFRLREIGEIRAVITLPSQEDIMALFAMTPYYYKTSAEDKAKLEKLSSLSTEIAFYLAVYEKL